MPVLAASFIGKRTHLIGLMNDIYPEGLVAKGVIRRGGYIETGLKRIFEAAYREFSALVFISEHHRRFVAAPGIDERSVVIPVSAHTDPFVGHEPAPVIERVCVTYCGTLGMMHDTGTFLGWLQTHGSHSPVRFLFHTSGASKRKFESDVRTLLARSGLTAEVTLQDALPEAPWIQVMKQSQVGLVFQDQGAAKIIFPSKMAGILAAGQAVLLVAEQDSDIARLVLDNGCGWVVTPGDVVGFESSLQEMLDAAVLLDKRRNAFRLGHRLFSKESVANRWIELFDQVTDATRSAI
jgi:colanic acid biosynthesis glycosyl transferase WcaI